MAFRRSKFERENVKNKIKNTESKIKWKEWATRIFEFRSKILMVLYGRIDSRVGNFKRYRNRKLVFFFIPGRVIYAQIKIRLN